MSNAERLKNLLAGALELPAESRSAYLDAACETGTALRGEVESLLRAHDNADRIMAEPTVAQVSGSSSRLMCGSVDPSGPSMTTAVVIEGPGTKIGPYKLLQLIGEGGFGSVFMAAQEHPVRRKVALKIIKLGMDTRAVIARFEAERQALAMMDHPNIARVLDAGATETGRPYFVMELVKGDPIIEYCDKNNLNIEGRLELFAQVCSAVQHAHTKGIIHRDIKPSNLLVSTQDGKPHTKVIDFGIAKATSSQLTEKTLYTEHKALIGTPTYMSPEQAEGSLDIDTRTDVYSLGVVLYELLTGTTPFTGEELHAAAYGEMQRIIREVDPPKPSTRISQNTDTLVSVAARRQAEPKRLGTLVRGELDWIVMKAMEKDRQRRYETANGLMLDIRRYLSGEAVVAAPPSALYRIRKLAQRNRVVLVTGALVAAVLLVASVVSVIFGVTAVRARASVQAAQATLEQSFEKERRAGAALAESNLELSRQRDEALRQRRLSRDVLNYVTSDLIAAVHPNRLGREASVRDWLMAASRSLTASDNSAPFAGEPEARIALDRAIGTAFQELDFADAARPHLERALNDAAQRYGRSSIETLLVMEPLVRARFALLDIEPATDLSKESLALCRAHHADNAALLIDLLNDYAAIEFFSWNNQGQPTAIERAFNANQEAVNLAERSNDPGRLVSSLKSLSRTRWEVGQREESRATAERAFDIATKAFGPKHVRTLEALHALAISKQRNGLQAESISHLQDLVVRSREVLGEHSQLFLMATKDIPVWQTSAGDWAAALVSWEPAIQYRAKALGPDHTWTLGARLERTGTLRNAGKLDEARAELLAVLVAARRAYGENHGFTAEAAQALAFFLTDRSFDAEALPYYAESSRATQAAAMYSGLVGPRIRAHADCLQRLGRPGEAIEVLRAGLGEDHSIINKRLDLRPVARDLIARLNALGEPERVAAKAEAAGWTKALGDWRALVEQPNISVSELIEIARELLTSSPGQERNPEAAAALLDRALVNAGDRFQLWERAADVYELGGMVDQEFKWRRKLVERADATADQLQKFSRRLRSVSGGRQDLRDSLRLAERATALAPTVESIGNLTEAQQAAGVPVGASLQQISASLTAARAKLPKDGPDLANQLAAFCLMLVDLKAWNEAEPLLRECLAIREKTQSNDWRTFNTKSTLGGALLGQNKLAEAEPLLLAGYEGMKEREAAIPPQGKVRVLQALERLVRLYEGKGSESEAAAWRTKLETAIANQANASTSGSK